MREVILYGAGKRGKRYACQLYEHGIDIAGFCDSYKKGNIVIEIEKECREKPIFKLEDIDNRKYIIIIAIADEIQFARVSEKIKEYGITVITLDKVFLQGRDIVADNRENIAEFHINNMDGYFERAEGKIGIGIFWNEVSTFFQMFKTLNLKKVVELACGRGRHVPQYIAQAEQIVLVDILEKNINYCKERFKEEKKIEYYVNNGFDLSELQSESCTALFTYDAMVHFEMLDVFQYLKETERVLVSGGRALFHHSNCDEDYKVTFSTGIAGRNYMSKRLFAHLANRAGFIVLKQQEIDWDGNKFLDCITLVEKL